MNHRYITLARIADLFRLDLGQHATSDRYYLQDPDRDEPIEFDSLEEVAAHFHDLIEDSDIGDLMQAIIIPDDFSALDDELHDVWVYSQVIDLLDELMDAYADRIWEEAAHAINDTLLTMLEEIQNGEMDNG